MVYLGPAQVERQMSGEFMQKAKEKSKFVSTDGLNLSIWRARSSAVCRRSPAHQGFVDLAFCRRGDLESVIYVRGNRSARFGNTARDNFNGKIRSAQLNLILCEYSVAFSGTIHLFERRGPRLRSPVVGKFLYIPEDGSLPDFSTDFSISQFCLFINSMHWCLFFSRL
jgi:hypothetical protein